MITYIDAWSYMCALHEFYGMDNYVWYKMYGIMTDRVAAIEGFNQVNWEHCWEMEYKWET